MDIRIVDGRLTKDAEVRVNKNNGKKYLTFSIANNGFSKGEQTTTYFNVISYNEHDISHVENLVKGKLVVISGKPNEVMTVRDGNTYLNRSIMAHSIEGGTYSSNKDGASQVATYRDVAPVSAQSPSYDSPHVVAPSAIPPRINTNMVNNENAQPVYQAQINNNKTSNNNDDDLPF